MLVEFKTISYLWPEIILILTATLIMLCGALMRPRNWWHPAALVAYVVVVLVLRFMPIWGPIRGTPSGPLAADYLGNLIRGMSLLIGLLFTMMAIRRSTPESSPARRWDNEFIGAIMLIVTGLMLVSQVNDLILLFVGMELVSIPTYVVLYLGKRGSLAAESTMKYFFLGILSSALLLYGFSFLYGVTGTSVLVGTADAPGMREILMGNDAISKWLTMLQIGIVLIVAGIGFKIAAVPFHFYAPDVFQGTSNSNAGLLAVAPKIAGIIALIRLLVAVVPTSETFSWQLLMILALLTMTVGNVCALWQTNLRRLMAFSSIAHAGYMLIGITVAMAAGNDLVEMGLAGTIFYLIVYSFASIGTFAALVFLSQDREIHRIDELRGLSQTQPIVAAALAIFMFSLAGIPPLAGFWGKMTLFGSAITMATNPATASGDGIWFAVLAIVGAINAAIAATYYLRIIAVMFFRPPQLSHESTGSWGSFAAMLSCTLLVVFVGLFPGSVMRSSNKAARSSRPYELPTVIHLSQPKATDKLTSLD